MATYQQNGIHIALFPYRIVLLFLTIVPYHYCASFQKFWRRSFLMSWSIFLSDSFSPCQLGFLPGRSTLPQLLLYINELLEAKTAGKTSDIIYLDLRKEFDSVRHDKLLYKLRSFGITGVLLKKYPRSFILHFNDLPLCL